MIFIDSANLDEVKKAVSLGVIRGATTNPKIFLSSGVKYSREAYFRNIREICSVVNGPVSVELTSINGDISEAIREASELRGLNPNVNIKVPMLGDGRGLKIIHALKEEDIPVNATCLMNAIQGILAAEAGADYVSLFYNRMIDDKIDVCQEFSALWNTLSVQGFKTKIIAGSIRQPSDVIKCLVLGANIVTVPPKILWELPKHHKTDETIKEFDEAWMEFVNHSHA